jgi:peptidoglycan glycosyltransferase
MNRIASRSWIVILLAALLVGGMLFFVGEFLFDAENWVRFSGSPHLYNGNHLDSGIITDRDGEVLLDYSGKRTYAADSALRKATLHWTGDRSGNVDCALSREFALDLSGYELLNGMYAFGTGEGKMTLTLSAKVQTAALEAMAGRKGIVAVYNYRTGELLCAVSTPTFDPDNVPDIAGDTTGAYEGVYLNRFTQAAYIPGSVFKIVTAAAALECVPDIMERTFLCQEKMTIEGGKVVCTGWHGEQTLKEAFANSCNCAFAQITELVGRENMARYVAQFGITQRLKFDGITTVAGNFSVEGGDRLSLCWSGIGQHRDLVNPARYLSFVGAIAAGGGSTQPHIVETVTSDGHTTYRAPGTVPERIMSRSTAKTLRELMRNNVVMKYGADHFPGLAVCAKSGTAETGSAETDALFAGFVADEAYPLAFFVVVEDGGFGSHTCVPVISKVLAVCKDVMDGQ